jgi:glycine betaine/proline transport system substrate-binding protein
MATTRRGKNLVGGALLMLACTGLQAAESAQCKTVRFGLMSWTDLIATTAVASTLFQRLGYTTEQTTAAQQIIYGGMRDNRLDAFVGYWKPSSDKTIGPYIEKGQVAVFPEPNLPDGQMTLAVPTWLADKGLKTFADIPRFEKELNGRIYGIDPGTDINNRLQGAIKENRFGLKHFKLVESSEAGMLAAVARSAQRKEGFVFIAWKPHPMNINMDLTYLTGSDGLMGPDEGKATVWTVTRAGYANDCPNANKLLSNIRFTADQEAKMMVQILDHADPMVVAKTFIADNPQVVEGWVAGVTTFSGSQALPIVMNTP